MSAYTPIGTVVECFCVERAFAGSDGEELEAGGCMFGFRNSGALTVRIAVQGSHISVSLGGSDVPMDQYHKCVQNVQFAHKVGLSSIASRLCMCVRVSNKTENRAKCSCL